MKKLSLLLFIAAGMLATNIYSEELTPEKQVDKIESLVDLKIPQHAGSTAVQKTKNVKWWTKKHNAQVALKEKQKDAQIIFIGASVMSYWTSEINGKGVKRYTRGLKLWEKYYAPRKALNFGIAGDTTATTLWRMQNGALDGISPKLAIMAVGHNNKGQSKEQIAEGMLAIAKEIRIRCPKTKILLMPYLPTTKEGWREHRFFLAYDIACERAKVDKMVIPLDVNSAFLNEKGVLKDQALIPDNLHPAEGGYKIWAEEMEPTIKKLLEEE